jgi:hypothetical protein
MLPFEVRENRFKRKDKYEEQYFSSSKYLKRLRDYTVNERVKHVK